MAEPDAIDFNSAAFVDGYDELPLWSAPFGLALLERVPLLAHGTYLDIGAGTGFLSLELAERCGPAARIIAVDPWGAALERLRANAARRGVRNIATCAQDALTLDLPDASVDVFVSNLGINNFDDPAGVMAMCARLARPGAQLVLTSNLVGHMAEFYAVYGEVLTDLGHGDSLAALERHVAHRATVESLTSLCRAAGFEIGTVDTGTFHMRFASGSALLQHYFIRIGFLDGWRSVAPPAHTGEVLAELARRLDAKAADSGELSLTIPWACVAASR